MFMSMQLLNTVYVQYTYIARCVTICRTRLGQAVGVHQPVVDASPEQTLRVLSTLHPPNVAPVLRSSRYDVRNQLQTGSGDSECPDICEMACVNANILVALIPGSIQTTLYIRS